jgi:hypothetical protein
MFRLVTALLAFSTVTVSLPAVANDPSPIATDDVIAFTDDSDRIDFESESSAGGEQAEAKWSVSNDRSDATFDGWARREILDAWQPRTGLVRQHTEFQTRVILNVDATGHVSSPVILSTNASGDFHDSIQKAISSVALKPPPKGQGQGIVIDFYADRAEKK